MSTNIRYPALKGQTLEYFYGCYRVRNAKFAVTELDKLIERENTRLEWAKENNREDRITEYQTLLDAYRSVLKAYNHGGIQEIKATLDVL